MGHARPPFETLTEYAGALAELVKDVRCSRSDVDLCADALDRYSELAPAIEHVDIGDGTTKAWQVGTSPFAKWSLGFSERFGLAVERLYENASAEPPDVVSPLEYRLEERTVSASPTTWIVFDDAPAASPNQHRVRYKRKWAIGEVREHHQMGVVEIAAAIKCEVLRAAYASTRTEQSDLFQGSDKVGQYEALARDYWARARRRLGIVGGRGLRHGRIQTFKPDVFRGSL